MSKTGSKTGTAKFANATSFSKEKPRPGPGRGKKKPVQEAGEAIVKEMELAYSTAEKPDDPVGVKGARLLAHNDYPKFLAMYLKAKELAGHVEVVPQEAEVVAAAVGAKEERVEELAERLLREWADEEAVVGGNHTVAAESGDGEAEEESRGVGTVVEG